MQIFGINALYSPTTPTCPLPSVPRPLKSPRFVNFVRSSSHAFCHPRISVKPDPTFLFPLGEFDLADASPAVNFYACRNLKLPCHPFPCRPRSLSRGCGKSCHLSTVESLSLKRQRMFRAGVSVAGWALEVYSSVVGLDKFFFGGLYLAPGF